MIYTVLLACMLLFLTSPGRAFTGPVDTLLYRAPMHFTENAGQWDKEVRYAVLGGRTSAWLCSDGLILARPRSTHAVPVERPLTVEGAMTVETASISFIDPSASMRIVALDTARAVSHFYLHPDSTCWYEHVPNYRVIRYENVWDGIDIEYREGRPFALQQTLHLRPGADATRIGFALRGAGAGEIAEMLAETLGQAHDGGDAEIATTRTDGGMQVRVGDGFQYKDSLHLTTEFNTTLRFSDDGSDNKALDLAVGRNGAATLMGFTDSPDLPVRKAAQNQHRGLYSAFVLCFDSTGRDYVYCTYIGGNETDARIGGGYGWWSNGIGGAYGMRTSRLGIDTEGRVYGAIMTTDAAPLLASSWKAHPNPPYDGSLLPGSTGYVFSLSPKGTLAGATYIGGPGAFYPALLSVVGDVVSVVGHAYWNDVRVSNTAAMRSRSCDTCFAVAIFTFDRDLTQEVASTWLVSNLQRYSSTLITPALLSADTGSVWVALGVGAGGISGTPDRILPQRQRGPHAGIWVGEILPGGLLGRSVFIADTVLPRGDYRPHQFNITSLHVNPAGELIVSGGNMLGPRASYPPRISSGWREQTLLRNLSDGEVDLTNWILRVSTDGEFLDGLLYGTSLTGAIMEPLYRNLTCGGFTMFRSRRAGQADVRLVDPDARNRSEPWILDRYVLDFDDELRVRYTSYWSAEYLPFYRPEEVRFHVDRHGYAYMVNHLYGPRLILDPHGGPPHVPRWHNSWRIAKGIPPYNEPYNWHTYSDNYLVRFRIYTPCWQVGCGIGSIDTLRIERRRLYLEPEEFEVNFAVTNRSAEKGARILHALIEVPPGFELVNGAPTQAMSPVDLSSGMTAQCSWTLRVTDQSLIADTAVLRCRVFYVDPESGQTYPPGEELCEHDIMVVRYDEADPNLVCTLDGPDTLFWTGEGYAATPDGPEAPIRYIAAFTNLDKDTVHIESFRIAAVEHCTIAGGAVRPGVTLAPGQSHVLTIDVTPLRLRHARTIRVSIEALDRFGLDISRCATETSLPTVTDLPCTASGPVRILWNVAASASTPPAPRYTLELSNPLDTARHDIRAWLDLSSSRHLAPAPGDSLTRDPFFINPKFRRSLSWRMLLAHPPASDTHDTLYFEYESDGMVRRCMLIVEILIIDESVLCSLHGPTEMSEAEVLNREQADLYYTLSNIGTVPMNVDRIDLVVSPDAGVTALDPLSQPGGTLAANSDMDRQWRLRALALRDERTARFDATAYDEKDVSLSVCTHNLHIPGIDGLLCDITAPDSVRFIRDELRYDPDPVPVTMALRNILDSDETLIEAEIDLTAAPRFELAAGETALKALPLIPAGETAQLQWLLQPLADVDTETQDIRIRYRSTEQGGWKECMASIVIEGWPRVAVVRCTVSGHDSLHVDPAYERMIPEPFEVSYTATNTGTVTLHNCEASIVLPPEFELDRGDITQSFGDIAPGHSVTRWWTLRTTSALSGFGAYQIAWTWRSDEQGVGEGCEHAVHIVPEASSGIVFTPLHLHFEAKRNDPLPAAQYVDLWTGGGLSMPWTAQGGDWWLASDLASGDRAARLAVQPVSTALPIGWHATALTIAGQAPNLPRDIAVTYEIHGILSVQTPGGRLQPGEHLLKLGEIWPQPVPLNGEARISVNIPPGEYARITLHDALGREVATLYDGMMLEADAVLRITPSALRMQPGMYFIRMIVAGSQAVRGVVVR
jgi:hypothetical protein